MPTAKKKKVRLSDADIDDLVRRGYILNAPVKRSSKKAKTAAQLDFIARTHHARALRARHKDWSWGDAMRAAAMQRKHRMPVQ